MKPDKFFAAANLPLLYAGISIFFLRDSIGLVLIAAGLFLLAQGYLMYQIATSSKPKDRLKAIMPFLMLMLGSFGVVASMNLSVEHIRSLEDPQRAATCSISPIVSCDSSMSSSQGAALGISNSLLGLAAFSALMAISFGMIAGAKYQAWLWRIIWLASLGGVFVVGWFVYQALYVLGALCIYCMLTWSAVLPLFVYVSLYVHQANIISFPKMIGDQLQKNHAVILTAMHAIIIVLIYFKFEFYWKSLI